MSLCIADAQLPGLAAIDDEFLKRITGSDSVGVLRFRYRPGKRAVLHIETQLDESQLPTEGVIWFFAGDKAERLSRRLPAVMFDEHTGALYERFPSDHRLPELQSFMSLNDEIVEDLIGGPLPGSPTLLRYRPGISCTFRCTRQDGETVFVKIIAKEDVDAIDVLNQRIARILGNSDVAIARSTGTYPPWQAVAYEEAQGLSLEKLAALSPASEITQVIRRVAMALERLSSIPGISARALGRTELMIRARNALRLIAISDREAGRMAATLVDRMSMREFEPRCHLIHGDMKLDHAFLDGDKVTFIDTESLSLGDPDYDIAKLEARLVATYFMGSLPAENLIAARRVLADYVSSNYAWYQDAAILQTAKFFAQRPSAENVTHCRTLLSGAL